MYKLNNNIIVVDGACRSGLYDLNSKNLYIISKEFALFLNNLSEYVKIPEKISTSKEFQQLLNDRIVLQYEDVGDKILKFIEKRMHKVCLEITQKCNFNCVHCYEDKKSYMDISFEVIKKVIDELVIMGFDHLHLIGGEPFIHPNFCEILYYCKGKFSELRITTNASILTDEQLEALLDVQPQIFASLHSDLDEGFNTITNTNGILPVVKKNIKKMQSEGLSCQIRKVKIANQKQSSKFEKYWGNISGYPILVGNATIHQYSREMLMFKAITEENFLSKLNVGSVMKNMHYQACFKEEIYIDVNMDVFPCILERRVCHGNIKKNSISSVLKNDICNITKDRVKGCKDCEYRYACNTCFADTNSEGFHAPPWFCTYNPYSGKWTDLTEWINNILKETKRL